MSNDTSKSFEARYRTWCQYCDQPLKPGEWARYAKDASGDINVVHEGCLEPADYAALGKPLVICTECFLASPCPCEDGQ